MIETLNFNYGNPITFVGLFGIISSAVIVYSAFTKHFRSPLNK